MARQDMTDDEIIRLAMECRIGDDDLSTDGRIVTDYGDATNEVLAFARCLLDRNKADLHVGFQKLGN